MRHLNIVTGFVIVLIFLRLASGKELTQPKKISWEEYYDKVHGGWLGKCIGGALGMPVEGWLKNRIAKEFGEIKGYIGYFEDEWKGWSGVLGTMRIPKDENWHQKSLEITVPQFDFRKNYARLIVGMTLEYTKKPAVLQISDISIFLNGKRQDIPFDETHWKAMEGCKWLEDNIAQFDYNGKRSWLRMAKPVAKKLRLKPGTKLKLGLRARWREGNDEIGAAFDFQSIEIRKGFGPDDDTAYQIVDLHALQTYGINLTSEQLGKEWVEHLPFGYTAEGIALNNLKKGIMPPKSAITDNPYSEWIGGQIKADIWGLVSPGRPDIAAKYGYIDGIIAHEKNGVWGEMFTAAVVSAAFFEKDIEKLLLGGLKQIPEDCLYAQVIRDCIVWHRECGTWEKAWDKLNEKYGKHYHPVHVLPNAGAVALALLYGNKDFGKSICLAVMSGWDTDCNGATVGCILGTMLGAKGIPKKWKEPIDDEFRSYVKGFENWKITELAKQICQIGEKIIVAYGGRVTEERGKKVLVIAPSSKVKSRKPED